MTKQEIINQLNAIYASRRTRAETIAQININKARQNKDYFEVEKSIKRLSFEVGKAEAFGSKDLAKQKNKELILERIKSEKILANIGLNNGDLVPKYACKNCSDTGKINGKLCECYKKELYNMLLKNSGAKTNLASFKDFNLSLITETSQKEQLSKIKNLFLSWVDNYPKVDIHTFLFCGTAGVGKTFMTECIAKAMIDKGYLVSFISSLGLNENFLKYHTTFDQNKQSFFDMFLEPELLVIDDLGTEQILKNVTINYLVALLNERNNLNKATIITTNLNLNDILERYGERVFSRIANKADSKMFIIKGEDLRLKTPHKNSNKK